MNLYSKDQEITKEVIQFQYRGEYGADFGGISRDVFSSFWKECGLSYLEGSSGSFVPKHKGVSDEEYITLGRILHHGFVLTGFLPVSLNQAYMEAMLIGHKDVTNEFVLKSFIKYMGPFEGSRISKVISSHTVDKDDIDFVIDLEGRYGMCLSPKAENVKEIFIQMARLELIDIPLHTMEKIRSGMTESSDGKQIWSSVSKEELDNIYLSQIPDPFKVASLLKPTSDCLTQDETRSFDFLKRYVSNISQAKCEDFLQFATGSSSIVVPQISVSFFEASSLETLPRAHTCGALLEIPSKCYHSFLSFKVTWDSLLDNPLSYAFNFQ